MLSPLYLARPIMNPLDREPSRTGIRNESNSGTIAMRTLQIVTRRKVLRRWTRICVGILLGWVFSAVAHATCTAPPKMKADLQASPTAEKYADLGTWFGNQKQFACAAQAYASAAKSQPDSESYQYMWGLSLYSAGRATEAEEPLRSAAHINPSDVRPHLALAAAFDQLKQTADAETEWRAALAIDPDSESALDALSQYLVDEKDYTAVVTLLGTPAETRIRSSQQSLNLGIAYEAQPD